MRIKFTRENFDRLVKIHEEAVRLANASLAVYNAKFCDLDQKMRDMHYRFCKFSDTNPTDLDREVVYGCPTCADKE